MDEFVDGSVIGGRRFADRQRREFRRTHEANRMGGVRRITEEIEFGRHIEIRASEGNRVITTTDVKRISIAERIRLTIHVDRAFGADVEDTEFTALSE
jgi:hypothetical protein